MRILLLLLCLSLPVLAELPTPAGWRGETIDLPPEFAPTMSWKGREVLRFSPGMFKADAPDFFSYVFLLELDEGEPDWPSQLLLYYPGLAREVSEGKIETSGFKVSLEGEESLTGTIDWVEPFTTRQAQTLHLEISKLGPRRWFVCASPADKDSAVWESLREIRAKTR